MNTKIKLVPADSPAARRSYTSKVLRLNMNLERTPNREAITTVIASMDKEITDCLESGDEKYVEKAKNLLSKRNLLANYLDIPRLKIAEEGQK